VIGIAGKVQRQPSSAMEFFATLGMPHPLSGNRNTSPPGEKLEKWYHHHIFEILWKVFKD
jgi:hypothetical protein